MIHVAVLMRRKEGMTKEQFDEYWSNTHATVFLGNPVAREKLVRYSQQHVDTAADRRLAAAMGVVDRAATASPDGIVHFWARDIDDLIAVFQSDYYRDVVAPDENNFVHRGSEEIMVVGVDDDKWVDGQVGAGVEPSKWRR